MNAPKIKCTNTLGNTTAAPIAHTVDGADADGGAATGTVPGVAQQEPDKGKCRDPANHQLLPKEQQFMPGAKQQIRQLGAIVADPQAKKLEHKTQRHHQM